MSQNKEKKSSRHRKIPHALVAEAVNTSENTVKAVLNGQRSNETDLGQKIEVAEMLLEDGLNKLLEEVKRVVQVPAKTPKK